MRKIHLFFLLIVVNSPVSADGLLWNTYSFDWETFKNYHELLVEASNFKYLDSDLIFQHFMDNEKYTVKDFKSSIDKARLEVEKMEIKHPMHPSTKQHEIDTLLGHIFGLYGHSANDLDVYGNCPGANYYDCLYPEWLHTIYQFNSKKNPRSYFRFFEKGRPILGLASEKCHSFRDPPVWGVCFDSYVLFSPQELKLLLNELGDFLNQNSTGLEKEADLVLKDFLSMLKLAIENDRGMLIYAHD